MWSPYVLQSILIQVVRNASGTEPELKGGSTRHTWFKKAEASARHMAGGYSFKGAVLKEPSASRPIIPPFGSVGLSRLAWSSEVKEGSRMAKSLVGLAPWAKSTTSTFGRVPMSRMTGSLQTDARVRSSGGLGCSINPEPSVTIRAMSMRMQKPSKSLPSESCACSFRDTERNPHKWSRSRRTRGSERAALWRCRPLATLHVEQGGPPRKPHTYPSRTPVSQNFWISGFLASPHVWSMTMSSETTTKRNSGFCS